MSASLRRTGSGNTIIHIVLILWAVLQLYPVIWLGLSSLKPSAEIQSNIFAPPSSIYLENYNLGALSERGITLGIYFVNSSIVTAGTIAILTVVSLLAGYALAKLHGPGKNLIIVALVGMLGIPVHSLVIPLYYFVAQLKLLSNYWGLILPYVGLFLPFSILLLQTYFRQFPDEIIEAAKIDGGGRLQIFLSIVMPVSIGGISTVLIINFLNVWNEFLFSLAIMKSNAAKTLPVGLMSFRGQYNVDWGPMLAAMFLATVPPLLFYIIFHRKIISGITAGSLRG
jgi:raffinose/stachyose/melibiose transport system permease protein